MSSEMSFNNDKVYYYVIGDTFMRRVNSDHPDAVERVQKNGKTVHERPSKALFGFIESIRLYDQEFDGKKIKKLDIYLDKNDEGKTPVISLTADTRHGEDVLKRLPNMDKETEYRFMPYVWTPEGKDKEQRGLSISTKDEEGKYTVKVPNFFWDEVEEKAVNGYPEATEEDKEDWKFYYLKANKFLVKYNQENILPKYEISQEKSPVDDFEYPEEEINPEDTPF